MTCPTTQMDEIFTLAEIAADAAKNMETADEGSVEQAGFAGVYYEACDQLIEAFASPQIKAVKRDVIEFLGIAYAGWG